ncbi:MAG: O-antigen ligase family protein [Acidobacteria bacterium]|nr:O-antigen ligase family protein [Acidobacteriota bacterium]
MRDRWPKIVLAAVVAQIPFELRYTLLGLTNLQWTFVALVLVSAPVLLNNWRRLVHDRLVQATALFVAIQWLAAFFAPEFHTNALKAAVRFSAGFVMLAIARSLSGSGPFPLLCEEGNKKPDINRTWAFTSAAAAAYALLAYAGLGAPWLFRDEEFYIGQIQRLSGSFEYPNTAAAYFAMSLPIVWWCGLRRVLKWTFAFFWWCAVVLTFSKGALAAVPIVVVAAARRRSIGLLAAGVAAYVVLSPVVERIYGPGRGNPIGAEYKPAWTKLQQQPGAFDQIPLAIRNTGVSKWRSSGWWRAAVAYRWWNRDTETFLRSSMPVVTKLPRDVERGEMVEVPASFQTPAEPGRYILVFELFSRDFNWFSQTGVIPTLIEVDIQPSTTRSVGQADLSSLYRRGRSAGSLTASVPRSSLWRAALRMFADHPLGVGPDNYRLQYGKYLGAERWDTRIYSNSLYLELLTGSGILGLAAFGLVLFLIPWTAEAPVLAVAVFLVHGLVDVFLMTTPIYFAFWLSVAAADDRRYSSNSP